MQEQVEMVTDLLMVSSRVDLAPLPNLRVVDVTLPPPLK